MTELVPFAVGDPSPGSVDWITRGVGRLYPAEWRRFMAPVPDGERPVDAYGRLLDDSDPAVADHAAREWCAWEDAHVRAPRLFYAGMAVVYAVSEAWDGDLDPDIYPLDTRDVDPDDIPVEALAAWALAGEDADARREFWRWYIAEAFPAAFSVVEQTRYV